MKNLIQAIGAAATVFLVAWCVLWTWPKKKSTVTLGEKIDASPVTISNVYVIGTISITNGVIFTNGIIDRSGVSDEEFSNIMKEVDLRKVLATFTDRTRYFHASSPTEAYGYWDNWPPPWRVTVGEFEHPMEVFTNVVEVITNHEHGDPPCTLVRYVRDGQTNDFHAWLVPVTVEK